MTSSPTPRIPCTRCGAMILPITARNTGGLCMPCKQNPPSGPLTAEEFAELCETEASYREKNGSAPSELRIAVWGEQSAGKMRLLNAFTEWLESQKIGHIQHGDWPLPGGCHGTVMAVDTQAGRFIFAWYGHNVGVDDRPGRAWSLQEAHAVIYVVASGEHFSTRPFLEQMQIAKIHSPAPHWISVLYCSSPASHTAIPGVFRRDLIRIDANTNHGIQELWTALLRLKQRMLLL